MTAVQSSVEPTPRASKVGESVHCAIPLRRRGGEVVAYALIDFADFERLGRRRWSLGKRGYPRARIDGKAQMMHRIVMDLELADDATGLLEVDHINGDRLDCRRSNLRMVTRAQNHQNRHRTRSRYRGTSWEAARGLWKAQATLDGRNYFLGRYVSEEAAAAAAARWRAEHMPYSTN